ncbi:unnamed protein product [Effrenium voratum]|nr:unnamed protein product [Effrenium voratum]
MDQSEGGMTFAQQEAQLQRTFGGFLGVRVRHYLYRLAESGWLQRKRSDPNLTEALPRDSEGSLVIGTPVCGESETDPSLGLWPALAVKSDAEAAEAVMAKPDSRRALVLVLLGVCLGSWLERSDAFVSLWSWTRQGSGRSSLSTRSRLDSKVARQATLVGSPAPAGPDDLQAIVEEDIEDIQLDSGRYVVLFFYPLDFTFVCPTEIMAFSDRIDEFKRRNTSIYGVSVDSVYSHLAWIQMPREEGGLGGLEYPLISDFHRKLATAFGVLSPEGVAYRALFIIDKEGIVQHATVNNLAFGRNVDEVLRTLDAIQYTQQNPDEVCPAGWQPGDKTMRPDFGGKREYFGES